jgi:hypothetical protein
MNRRRPAIERYQADQILTPAEEDTLAADAMWITALGWSWTMEETITYGTDLLKLRGVDRVLTYKWYRNFLRRHPTLKFVRSKSYEMARFGAESVPRFEQYFKLFDDTIRTYGITTEDIYNMDEKGFMMGTADTPKVLIPRSEFEARLLEPGNRDWTSIIKTIGTSYAPVPPFVIFKGKILQH